jgi:hypothetical protein
MSYAIDMDPTFTPSQRGAIRAAANAVIESLCRRYPGGLSDVDCGCANEISLGGLAGKDTGTQERRDAIYWSGQYQGAGVPKADADVAAKNRDMVDSFRGKGLTMTEAAITVAELVRGQEKEQDKALARVAYAVRTGEVPAGQAVAALKEAQEIAKFHRPFYTKWYVVVPAAMAAATALYYLMKKLRGK